LGILTIGKAAGKTFLAFFAHQRQQDTIIWIYMVISLMEMDEGGQTL